MWPTGNSIAVYFAKYIPADLFVVLLKLICMSACSVRPGLRSASCSTFSEKCLLFESRGRRWRRKRWLRPKQFSMSNYILGLLADLIHNYRPPFIINEQVQCHTAQEPVLPISNTTAVAVASMPGTSTAEPSCYLLQLWPHFLCRDPGRLTCWDPNQNFCRVLMLVSTNSLAVRTLALKFGPWVKVAFRCA